MLSTHSLVKISRLNLHAFLLFKLMNDLENFEDKISNPETKKLYLTSRTFANFRHSSLDGLTNGRGTSLSRGLFSRPRPSSSETNLRKLALGDLVTRPGSALGLLQGKMREKRPARRLFFLLCQLFWPEKYLSV